jgi:hypothetical protein
MDDPGLPPDPFLEPDPLGEPAKLRFIHTLAGADYQNELEKLAAWVENLLVPIYGREVSSTALWCPCWWDHPEAIGRLHAVYLAWLELTGAQAELYGPGLWHRDYLDPMMVQLRGPDGPFAACSSGDRPNHTVLTAPPVQPLGEYGRYRRPPTRKIQP